MLQTAEGLAERFSRVRAFVFDMDGVLTDGGLWLLEAGEWLRRMHIHDGFALQLAVQKGYRVAVISCAESRPVRLHLGQFNIQEVHMSVSDKAVCLKGLLKSWGLAASAVLYMGDDLPDLPAMRLAGIACCPANATSDVRAVAAYISTLEGGNGCVRDVIERVLRSKSDWQLLDGIQSV